MALLIFGQLMKAVYNFFTYRKIRLGYMLSLIFFVLTLVACKQDSREGLSIEWKNNQAKGISIPKSLLGNDATARYITVRLESSESPILGDYSTQDDDILFQPLIPLTRGLSYDVFFRDKLIGKIRVPQADVTLTPALTAVYPSVDSLPENLLKIYLQFSAPMQEGVALQHIALLDERGDTMKNVFLNLQQELWNKERTALTLWLDPGRIKRDLIPNQEMGNPLQTGHSYTLSISSQWKDVQGLPLQQSYNKQFFVGKRDDTSPQPTLWKLDALAEGSKQTLNVELNEPLDFFLLQETITIVDATGNKVAGAIKVSKDGRRFDFIPADEWKNGLYHLRIATYLEDLAGNNLLRPFDRDVTKEKEKEGKDFIEIEFIVK